MRLVGTCRFKRNILSKAAEPGLGHVLLQMAKCSTNPYNSGTSRWRVDSVAYGNICRLRMRTTSWRNGSRTRSQQQTEERPWSSSPSGPPDKTRQGWSSALRSFAEHLPYRSHGNLLVTCEVLGLRQKWRASTQQRLESSGREWSARKKAPVTIQCGHAETLRVSIARPSTRTCLQFTIRAEINSNDFGGFWN